MIDDHPPADPRGGMDLDPGKKPAEMRDHSPQQPQPPGRGGGQRGKPPDPPQLVGANIQLRSAQAQKALAQAREIDARTGTTAPKLALEAMAQKHAQNLDTQKQQSKHKVDSANAMARTLGAVSNLAKSAQPPTPNMGPQTPDQGTPNGSQPQ